MKKPITPLFFSGLLFMATLIFPASSLPVSPALYPVGGTTGFSANDLKAEAFAILDAKCNTCHRKQNPFRVFTLKNMNRHGARIYKQVFVYRRMPKGNAPRLTDLEYRTLKLWIDALNL